MKTNLKYACAYYERGMNFYSWGKYDAALLDFHKAAKLYPQFSHAETMITKTNELVEISKKTKGIPPKPKNIPYAISYYQYGCALQELEQTEEAKKAYLKAIAFHPEFSQAIKALQKIQPDFDPQSYRHLTDEWKTHIQELSKSEKQMPDSTVQLPDFNLPEKSEIPLDMPTTIPATIPNEAVQNIPQDTQPKHTPPPPSKPSKPKPSPALMDQDTHKYQPKPSKPSSVSKPTVSKQHHAFFEFPERINTSIQDKIKKHVFNSQTVTQNNKQYLSPNWKQIIAASQQESPVYTAVQGHPIILVLFTGTSFTNNQTIKDVLASEHNPGIFIKAFTNGGYPLMRILFKFPDIPDDPLYLETITHVKDGNFQDFMNAIQTNSHLDILFKHESQPQVLGYSVKMNSSFKTALINETKSMLNYFQSNPSGNMQQAINKLYSMYPNAQAGIDAANIKDLPNSGGPKCMLLPI